MLAHQAFGAYGFAPGDGSQQVFMVGLRAEHIRRLDRGRRGRQGQRGGARQRRLVVVFQGRQQGAVSGSLAQDFVKLLVDAAPGPGIHHSVGISHGGRQQLTSRVDRLGQARQYLR
ncbi:hypothetical protein D3C72_1983510 [compost metagenome]